jgi:hypothetical protein
MCCDAFSVYFHLLYISCCQFSNCYCYKAAAGWLLQLRNSNGGLWTREGIWDVRKQMGMKRTIPHPQLLSDFHNPSPIYMTPLLVLNELCLCEHVKICDAVCVNSWVLCCLLLYLSWLWDLFLISEGHLQACALHESSSNNIQEHFIKVFFYFPTDVLYLVKCIHS